LVNRIIIVYNLNTRLSLIPQVARCSRTPLLWINWEDEISGYAEHPDMQNIRIIGFFFENKLHCKFEVEKFSTGGFFGLYTYLRTNIILIQNSLYVFDNWWGWGGM